MKTLLTLALMVLPTIAIADEAMNRLEVSKAFSRWSRG